MVSMTKINLDLTDLEKTTYLVHAKNTEGTEKQVLRSFDKIKVANNSSFYS